MTLPSEQRHAELSILGYLLAWGDKPDIAADVLSICAPETFMHPDTRAIAESIFSLAERREAVDLAGIAHEMKTKATLAEIGGAGTLAGIVMQYKDMILTETRLFEAAKELSGEHTKREAVRDIAAVLRDIQEPGADAGMISDKLRGVAAILDGGAQVNQLPFHPLSGDDLLSLPRPLWRVKDIFPKCGTAVVYGPSRAGKTFSVLDLVLAMAKGEEWFGWKTVSCDIQYICLESVWGLQGRLKAWTIDKKKSIPGNIRFIIESFDLGNKQHIKAISSIAPKNGVLVIDTLNRAAPGADENSSKDMGLIIKAADDISKAMEGLVILVSHSGKDATRGLRGHSSLFASLDASIEVGRNGDTRFIKVEKVKEAEDGAKKFFRLKSVVIGADEAGQDVTSCVLEPMDDGAAGKAEHKPLSRSLEYALESLVKALRHEQTSSVNVETWRKYFYEGHTAESDEAKRQAFHRARTGLVEREKIFVINDCYGVTVRDNGVTCNGLSRTKTP